MTSSLARLALKVQSFSDLQEFYCDLLGMQHFGSKTQPLFGYNRTSSLLEFQDGADHPYHPNANDLYWKLGITLRDLDHAVSFLKRQNYEVSEPKQFRDIGYLSHLIDPKGFTIELLQQGFEGHAQEAGSGHPIGAQATLAHTTLRVTDIDSVRRFCENELGMHLLSVQPVKDLNFCLYFYGWGDERPPHANLTSVDNREWLWARPYMLLELQHLMSSQIQVTHSEGNASGFIGLGYQNSETLTFLTAKQFLCAGQAETSDLNSEHGPPRS